MVRRGREALSSPWEAVSRPSRDSGRRAFGSAVGSAMAEGNHEGERSISKRTTEAFQPILPRVITLD